VAARRPNAAKSKLGKSGHAAPVVVLSNRLPLTFKRTRRGLQAGPSAGGLVSAIDPVLRARGGTWIGWPGVELRKREKLPATDAPYTMAPISLTETEVNRYYHGLSNRTLWPLFHSLPARAEFHRRDWATYQKVNQRFADAALPAARDADLVWVHDYHLTLTPGLVRDAVPDARLAFFLHIPFPPWDIFRLLPWSREVLRGMLACDLIGFHVQGYVQNFLDCAEKRLGARVDRAEGLIDIGGRVVRAGAFPLGIDFELYESRAEEAPRPRGHGERIVLGVDRLDYTKGIPERIRAFERLLELHPNHRGRLVLLQLAVPSRSQVDDYRDLKREIDELVGRVNGRFATDTWSPIRYLYRAVSPERLAAMYRDADVALVTPLRDGMNLVAKEFVASQVDEPGVLVLSEMAGAAATMREAVLVNPYSIDETAEALHLALSMEETDRASRMLALRRRERRDDVQAWVTRFLDAARSETAELRPISDDEVEEWLASYLRGYRTSLFLDYDGTLTPLVDHPDQAGLAPGTRALLKTLSRRDDTEVAIVSGRSLDDVRSLVNLDRATYAGNHGLEVSAPDLPHFEHEDAAHYRERITELAEDLEEVCVDGAWVESKGHTLTWHYRQVSGDPKALVSRATELISKAGFQAREAHRAVEARPPIGWDKGRAVLHVLRSRYGPSWPEEVRVIYIGDDQTDEDAFRILAGMAMTFRVGPADMLTLARRRLSGVDAVIAVLHWLAQREKTRE
jgi:trehalose 6-phosphate synthase/phosphatase